MNNDRYFPINWMAGRIVSVKSASAIVMITDPDSKHNGLCYQISPDGHHGFRLLAGNGPLRIDMTAQSREIASGVEIVPGVKIIVAGVPDRQGQIHRWGTVGGYDQTFQAFLKQNAQSAASRDLDRAERENQTWRPPGA